MKHKLLLSITVLALICNTLLIFLSCTSPEEKIRRTTQKQIKEILKSGTLCNEYFDKSDIPPNFELWAPVQQIFDKPEIKIESENPADYQNAYSEFRKSSGNIITFKIGKYSRFPAKDGKVSGFQVIVEYEKIRTVEYIAFLFKPEEKVGALFSVHIKKQE